jgi:Concanavalin A-like lectin/glucanases superfamily
LVAHWTFDEAGGSTQVVDSVGGIIGNLSATGASLVSGGKAGGALSLSKVDTGYVTMGDVLSLGTGPYSFVAWVKTSTKVPGTFVLAKHSSGTPSGYLIGINKDGDYGADNMAWFYNYSDGLISTTSVNDDQWHQIVGVRGNGVLKIYVDGLPVESSQADQGLTDPLSGTPFVVGGDFWRR